MALFSKKKEAVGLDIGHGAVKAVHVVQQSAGLAVRQMALLDAHREGILDEEELRTSMLAWLEEKGLRSRSLTVGIPQFLATTQITDFPPNAKDEELRGMVSFETAQLAGLSDESFSSDYHVMAPKFGRQNPVLIGVCRQSVIDERSTRLTRDGLHVVDFGMNGLAMANTFYHLHPEAIENTRPSLLLDIGDESTTLLVVAGGQVLFAGSLMFGAARYTEALAAQLGCDDAQADQKKRDISLDPELEDHPLHAITIQLQAEMRNAVEHWRAGEKEDLADLLLDHIWLTGGGASLDGLADCLGRVFGCETAVFGPPDADTGQPVPSFSTAFGLALQYLGAAEIAISLAPMELRWRLRRRRLFPYLLAAEFVVAVLLASLLVRYHFSLAKERMRLEQAVKDLRECKALLPKLDDYLASMDHYERMLIPFVEKGNRGRRFVATVNELDRVRGDDISFVYLADRLSFDKQAHENDKEGTAPVARQPAATTGGLGAGMFASSLSEARKASAPPLLNATPVAEIEQIPSMVIGGYMKLQTRAPRGAERRNPYDPLLKMEDLIKEKGFFGGLNPITPAEREGTEERVFSIWEVFLRKSVSSSTRRKYQPFMYDMPFVRFDIDKEAISPKSAGGKSK